MLVREGHIFGGCKRISSSTVQVSSYSEVQEASSCAINTSHVTFYDRDPMPMNHAKGELYCSFAGPSASSGNNNKRAVVVQLMSACVSSWISCTTTKKWPNLFFFPLLVHGHVRKLLAVRCVSKDNIIKIQSYSKLNKGYLLMFWFSWYRVWSY